ncbi:unnamed protein product [Closterium sp. Yama58-4]|nr:unnamed protein product [Closterium sp. Yama58-4]
MVQQPGSEDHLIHAHLRNALEVEVLEDVCEEELDELIPNPFYPDPVAAADVALVAEAGEGGATEEDSEEDDYEEDKEESEESSDDEDESEEEDEGEAEEEVGGGQGWDDDDDWWKEGRYDGEEVEEWVAG